MNLRVAEIFESISGEVGGFPQGSPTTFVRLAGCHLGCPFCDTRQYQHPESGKEMEVREILQEIRRFPWKQVLITGGEPLEQKQGVQSLVNCIKGSGIGWRIQIETNGTIPINDVHLVDYWVVDLKGIDTMTGLPYIFNPGMVSNNMWIKCLIGSDDDLDSAIGLASSLSHVPESASPKIALSPIASWVTPENTRKVIQAILESKLPVLYNTQIHKLIGAR